MADGRLDENITPTSHGAAAPTFTFPLLLMSTGTMTVEVSPGFRLRTGQDQGEKSR